MNCLIQVVLPGDGDGLGRAGGRVNVFEWLGAGEVCWYCSGV